jgi:hypothetical protein
MHDLAPGARDGNDTDWQIAIQSRRGDGKRRHLNGPDRLVLALLQVFLKT